MSEHEFIIFCSPTLAGIKTGNLFTAKYRTKAELTEEIRRFNLRFRDKGLRLTLLSYTKTRANVYLYRPKYLKHDILDSEAASILRRLGYKPENADRCVAQLAWRMKQCSDREHFPHEIGLFLGYPPEDVRGFMEHKDEGCKCTGFWKVYGDRQAAERTFDSYRKCTRIYDACFERGTSLDKLAVCTR